MQASELLSQVSETVEESRLLLKEKEALRMTAGILAKSIEEMLEKTQQLARLMKELEAQAAREGTEASPGQQIEELNSLEVFLKRNLQFEREKAQRQNPLDKISQKDDSQQVYSAIEEKVKKSLLNVLHFTERSIVKARSENTAFSGSRQAQDVLSLLKARENELEELKKKYNSLMAQGLLARVEQQGSADFEEELQNVSRSLEVAGNETQILSSEMRGTIEKLQKGQSVLEQKIRTADELISKFMSKSLETITVLKKERDAAKKFALDLEHETTLLRQTYSKELLGMQEHKMQLQKEMQNGFSQRTKSLELELRQKSEFLEHFKKLAEDKEAELRKLKESLEHHKGMLHHYARHEKARKKHSKKQQ